MSPKSDDYGNPPPPLKPLVKPFKAALSSASLNEALDPKPPFSDDKPLNP